MTVRLVVRVRGSISHAPPLASKPAGSATHSMIVSHQHAHLGGTASIVGISCEKYISEVMRPFTIWAD